MIVASAVALFVAFVIGIMSLAGIHSHILRMRLFRFLPLSRFLNNSLCGIEKLKALDEIVTDSNGAVIQSQKQGIVRSVDKGFNELIDIIKDTYNIEGEFQKIILVEDEAGVIIGNAPNRIRMLALRKDGEDISLPNDPFDPSKPIRELENMVAEIFRKRLSYWILGLLGLWLAANSVLLYLSNV